MNADKLQGSLISKVDSGRNPPDVGTLERDEEVVNCTAS